MTIRTTSDDVLAFYAEHSHQMTPEERATMAEAAKVMRRVGNTKTTSPRIVSDIIEQCFEDWDSPLIDNVGLVNSDYNQPTLLVSTTDGRDYLVSIEENQ